MVPYICWPASVIFCCSDYCHCSCLQKTSLLPFSLSLYYSQGYPKASRCTTLSGEGSYPVSSFLSLNTTSQSSPLAVRTISCTFQDVIITGIFTFAAHSCNIRSPMHLQSSSSDLLFTPTVEMIYGVQIFFILLSQLC